MKVQYPYAVSAQLQGALFLCLTDTDYQMMCGVMCQSEPVYELATHNNPVQQLCNNDDSRESNVWIDHCGHFGDYVCASVEY